MTLTSIKCYAQTLRVMLVASVKKKKKKKKKKNIFNFIELLISEKRLQKCVVRDKTYIYSAL